MMVMMMKLMHACMRVLWVWCGVRACDDDDGVRACDDDADDVDDDDDDW